MYTFLNPQVILDIQEERKKQDEKWGVQRHSWPEWESVLVEEVGESTTEANKLHWGSTNSTKLLRLYEETVQVAAVAVAMLEHIHEELTLHVEKENQEINDGEK